MLPNIHPFFALGVQPLTLSVSPTSASGSPPSFQTNSVTVSYAGGPTGVTPTISWAEVNVGGGVGALSPTAFTTAFGASSYAGGAGTMRATVTRGGFVAAIDVYVEISGYSPLVVSGGAPPVYATANPDGSFATSNIFSVSGGSGSWTVTGGSLTPSYVAPAGTFPPGTVNAGPFVLDVTVQDDVTGESVYAGVAVYVSNP